MDRARETEPYKSPRVERGCLCDPDLRQRTDAHVRLRMDNTVAISYINKMHSCQVSLFHSETQDLGLIPKLGQGSLIFDDIQWYQLKE